MSERLFDPVAFMNENQAANATRREARPQGEALGQVVALDWKNGTVKKAGDNFGKPWYRLDVKIEVTDPAYLALRTGSTSDKETFTYGMMYDGDETGRPKVGPNVNIALGRFREACNANGQPYGMCVGAPVRIAVGHKPHPSEVNPDGSPIILDEVTALTRG